MTEHPKEEPIVTDEELEVLKKVRAIRSGQSGPIGGAAYQLAMAEAIQGQGGGQRAEEPAKGPGAPASPPGKAAPATPQGPPAGIVGQGPATPRPEGAGSPSQVPTSAHL
eukprot:12850336-Heterocapsa_arctica.AAC.1